MKTPARYAISVASSVRFQIERLPKRFLCGVSGFLMATDGTVYKLFIEVRIFFHWSGIGIEICRFDTLDVSLFDWIFRFE